MKRFIVMLACLGLFGCNCYTEEENSSITSSSSSSGGQGGQGGEGGSGGDMATSSSASGMGSTTSISSTSSSSSSSSGSGGSTPECYQNSDCPDHENTACQINSCNNGFCNFETFPNGTVVVDPSDPIGDCHALICDGINSEPLFVIDDVDVPASGNECVNNFCVDGFVASDDISGESCTNDDGFAGTCDVGVCERNEVICQLDSFPGDPPNIRTCPSPNAGMGVPGIIHYNGFECVLDDPNLLTPSCIPGTHCIVVVNNNIKHGTCL